MPHTGEKNPVAAFWGREIVVEKKPPTTRNRGSRQTEAPRGALSDMLRAVFALRPHSYTARRHRAFITALLLIAVPLLVALPGAVATAATQQKNGLEFTYTATPTTLVGSGSVTYTYTIKNTGGDIFYRASISDSNCSPLTLVSGPAKTLRPGQTSVYRCTTTVSKTTTSTANITYYTYNEFWDPLITWSYRDTRVPNTETVTVTPDPTVYPLITCETPTVYVAENATRALTMLNNQYQHPTGSEFIKVRAGTITVNSRSYDLQYNAIAWNPADKYIYAISSRPTGQLNNTAWLESGHLLQIDANGVARSLGKITGVGSGAGDYPSDFTGGMTSGAISEDGTTFYFSNASTSGSGRIYSISLSPLSLAASTLYRPSTYPYNVYHRSNTQMFTTNDFTFMGGYLWGIRNPTIPRAADLPPHLLRFDITDKTVRVFDLTGVIPGNKTYGAAWTYGNGNLGFSDNDASGVYQIKVTNTGAASPTFELVYRINGPGSYNNDGTSCFDKDKPVDLKIEKSGPARPLVGTTVTWNLLITNNGPGISSGGILTDTVPAQYTDVQVEEPYRDVCSVDGNKVTCHTGVLNVGDSYAIPISATAPATVPAGCLVNSATILGNEADPNDSNNTGRHTSCVTNAIIDIEKKPGTVIQTGTNTYTSSYTINVHNKGTSSNGLYTQITDSPHFASGLTVTGMQWSTDPKATPEQRTTASLSAGTTNTYLIGTDAEKSVAPGKFDTYTVWVSFTYNGTSPISKCNGAANTGLFNQVIVPEEDSAHTGNNTACNDPAPWINVDKDAVADSVTGPDSNGFYTVAYKVFVTNDGLADGTYGKITDTLQFDPNLTPVKATWSGKTTGSASFTSAPYTFGLSSESPATTIDKGDKHTYDITVTYRINTPGATLSTCSTTPVAGKGLFNSVSLPGENGPETDNFDCADPRMPKPAIDIVKTADYGSKDGSLKPLPAPGTVKYTYEVTNPTPPSSPDYEPIANVVVVDDKAEAAGVATLTYASGDTDRDGLLDAGETWIYTWTTTLSETTTNIATVTGTGVASGTPVTDKDDWKVTLSPKPITVKKFGVDGMPLAGAAFAIYETDPTKGGATPIANGIKPDASGTTFTSIGLTYGKTYWLVETQAPTGHQLLAKAVEFSLTGTGSNTAITLAEATINGATVKVDGADEFTINVTDAPAATLPQAGGSGPGAPLLSLLILGGGMALQFANRRKTAGGE